MHPRNCTHHVNYVEHVHSSGVIVANWKSLALVSWVEAPRPSWLSRPPP